MPEANNAIKILLGKLAVITEDKGVVEQAISSNFTDFEDAVQFYAAKSANADFIITRNTKDYTQSTISVLTAEHFLREL